MAGLKERGARQLHKRLLYCLNVNRTSLDHLLLGRNADVDKNVECSEYSAGPGRCQKKRFLNLWVWARESKLRVTTLIRHLDYFRVPRYPPGIEVTQAIQATQNHKSTNGSLLRLCNSYDLSLDGTDVVCGSQQELGPSHLCRNGITSQISANSSIYTR